MCSSDLCLSLLEHIHILRYQIFLKFYRFLLKNTGLLFLRLFHQTPHRYDDVYVLHDEEGCRRMLVELTLSDRSHAPNVLPMSDFFKRRPTTAARAGRGRGCHDRRLASSRPARAQPVAGAGAARRQSAIVINNCKNG